MSTPTIESSRTWIRRRGVASLVMGALGLADRAHAAGVEDTVAGTVALGRAAHYARVNDFMATSQNPANLAVSGRSAGLELRLPIFSACFDRAKDTNMAPDYDPDEDGTPGIAYKAQESFEEVCNDATPLPSGNIGAVVPLMRSASAGALTLGFGVFTPAGVGALSFGDDTVITVYPTNDEQLPITTSGTEAGSRFLLIQRTVLAAFGTVGLGYAPIPELRVGASFGWGVADVNYQNVGSVVQGFTDQQVVNDVHVTDYFVPRATLSIGSTPTPWLDLMASFTYTDDVEADGYVDITANGIQNSPRRSCRDDDPGPYCRVDDATLTVPYQRFEVALGARYAQQRAGRAQVLDPLADEVWDVEVNGYWADTSQVDEYALDLYPADDTEPPTINFSSNPAAVDTPLPRRAALPHGWRDTYGARLGGDYNVIASRLALRLGVSYETRGVPIKNMNVDYWPVSKVGLHAGLTWRIGPWDLHAAYVHLFNETVTVPVGRGNINEVTAIPDDKKLAVNEGRYTSSQDVLSLQGSFRF